MKSPLTGEPIRQDAKTIVMQEGNAVATYSREYYRLASESEPQTRFIDLQLVGDEHAIAVPVAT